MAQLQWDFAKVLETKRLQGEIAIVTGSDSGIGQAIAIAFAQEGADVTVTYFNDTRGAQTTCDAIEALGRRAACLPLDQRDADQVATVFQKTEAMLGAPTILVNNAAIGISGKPFHELSHQDWDLCLKTNLYGPFYCCKAFIDSLAQRQFHQHGSIINITSVHQEIPHLGASEYDASKGALRNLTQTLALEYADKNININNIAPGMILTPMNQEAIDNPDEMANSVRPIPMQRPGEPWEIARAAVFLASKDARYIQGATLTIDGGLSLYHGQEEAQSQEQATLSLALNRS